MNQIYFNIYLISHFFYSFRVTKPIIPTSILKNFEQQEVEKTKLLIGFCSFFFENLKYT